MLDILRKAIKMGFLKPEASEKKPEASEKKPEASEKKPEAAEKKPEAAGKPDCPHLRWKTYQKIDGITKYVQCRACGLIRKSRKCKT
jgi:hypothetical protein